MGNGGMIAKDLIPTLKDGLEKLEADSKYYEQFAPANGWGSYDTFLKFVRSYLEECQDYPEAIISIC